MILLCLGVLLSSQASTLDQQRTQFNELSQRLLISTGIKVQCEGGPGITLQDCIQATRRLIRDEENLRNTSYHTIVFRSNPSAVRPFGGPRLVQDPRIDDLLDYSIMEDMKKNVGDTFGYYYNQLTRSDFEAGRSVDSPPLVDPDLPNHTKYGRLKNLASARGIEVTCEGNERRSQAERDLDCLELLEQATPVHMSGLQRASVNKIRLGAKCDEYYHLCVEHDFNKAYYKQVVPKLRRLEKDLPLVKKRLKQHGIDASISCDEFHLGYEECSKFYATLTEALDEDLLTTLSGFLGSTEISILAAESDQALYWHKKEDKKSKTHVTITPNTPVSIAQEFIRPSGE